MIKDNEHLSKLPKDMKQDIKNAIIEALKAMSLGSAPQEIPVIEEPEEEIVEEVIEEPAYIPTQEELTTRLRNEKLSESDWIVQRHQEEKMFGTKPTLSALHFSLLMKYRHELRKLSDDPDFPNVEWPEWPLDN